MLPIVRDSGVVRWRFGLIHGWRNVRLGARCCAGARHNDLRNTTYGSTGRVGQPGALHITFPVLPQAKLFGRTSSILAWLPPSSSGQATGCG